MRKVPIWLVAVAASAVGAVAVAATLLISGRDRRPSADLSRQRTTQTSSGTTQASRPAKQEPDRGPQIDEATMARSFDQQLARKGIITVGVTKCSENLAPGGSDTDTGPNGWECTFQPDAQLRGDPLYDTGRSDNNAWIINVSINTTKRCWSAKSAGYGDTGRDDYGLENALGNPLTGCLVELDHPPKDPSPGH